MSKQTNETDRLNAELKRLLENVENKEKLQQNEGILKLSLSIAQTQKLRQLKCQPNRQFSHAQVSGGENKQFFGHEVGRVAFPMDGLGPKGSNPINKDVSNFGGEPFQIHKGTHCHRGAQLFKKPEFHPLETTKRVFYREDGSGRDGYILANNGGLTVSKKSYVNGTDQQAVFSNNLRAYSKDMINPGYHRVSMALKVADNYIEKNLKIEEADFSGRYNKKLSSLLQKQLVQQELEQAASNKLKVLESKKLSSDQYKTFSTQNENLSQLLDRKSQQEKFIANDRASIFTNNNFKSINQEKFLRNSPSSSIIEPKRFRQREENLNSIDIRSVLQENSEKLSKHELYFRNQEKLMKNAIIPESERFKINQKSKFQSKHSDSLSQPRERNLRQKFITDRKDDSDWVYTNKKPLDLSKGDINLRHDYQQSLNANQSQDKLTKQLSVQSKFDQNVLSKIESINQPFNSLKAIIKRNNNQNKFNQFIPHLPGATLIGQGSSLQSSGGEFQAAASHFIVSKFNKSLQPVQN